MIHLIIDDVCMYDFVYDSSVSMNSFELRPRAAVCSALPSNPNRVWKLQSVQSTPVEVLKDIQNWGNSVSGCEVAAMAARLFAVGVLSQHPNPPCA